VAERLPLTTLLTRAWVAHTIEVDNAFEALSADRMGRRFRISLPMWTNGLRCIDEKGTTVTELRSRAGASCNIAGLERWGWIAVGEQGQEKRPGYGSMRGVKGDSVLRPTRSGTYARRRWPRVVEAIEVKWRERFGSRAIDDLRSALRPLAAPMPWSPPEVNPSDGFVTHACAGGGDDGWDLPLVGLLGQALTLLTLESERHSKVSLPLAANFLRVIDSERVPIRDLPALAGVSKEAIAMGVSFLCRKTFAISASDRTVSLTPSGLAALNDYRNVTRRPSDDRLRDALEDLLSQGGALSSGLLPPPGCWRGQRPYLAQTERFLADPMGRLPWHPMVLHRGGWPDGS
jgi:hypothetical protein